MKAAIDTNVLISYLLAPRKDSSPRAIVRSAIGLLFEPVISIQTIGELERVTRENAYLTAHIDPRFVEELVQSLDSIGGIDRTPRESHSRVVRDRNDDYLIAHAAGAGVDVLVSGDKDLLSLDGEFRFRIVSPAEFMRILEQEQQSS